MYPKNQDLPTPLTALDTLLEQGTNTTPYKVFICHNLGNRSFNVTIPMHEFFGISEVANEQGQDGQPVAQRKLNLPHARKLAVYILKGLVSAAIQKRQIDGKEESPALRKFQEKLGYQPYLSLQPLVCNIRTCSPKGANLAGQRLIDERTGETACFKVMLSQKDVLWVIDGQHRRYGMHLVFEFLDYVRKNHSYPKKNALYPADTFDDLSDEELSAWQECYDVARSFCTVNAEVHLGLNPEEERQLFHDLNNLGKKVEASLALQFDNSNPINRFIKEVLVDDILGWEIVEKDIINWEDDTGAVPRKDLVAVNALLFLNKTNISGATPPVVDPKKETAIRFWEAVREIPGLGEKQAKLKTVAAQPVVLKALAKLTYDFAFGKRKPENANVHLDTLLNNLHKIDFSHDNPMWRYYELTDEQRRQYGLASLTEYLPSDEEGYNRDIGAYIESTKVMRFGAKHNDIFPIIGDMVRWRLGLPNRHQKKHAEAAAA